MSAAPTPSPAPTQTGYTLLGLLSFGRELSGYELKQWADNLRFFWSAPAMSQVYREVERLAAAGLISQRTVVRDGARSAKVYRLTPEGEQVVRAWLATPPGPPVLRHPVALRVFFGHLLDPDGLHAALEAHRAWCDDMLAELGRVRADLGDDEQWRYVALVAEWGLDYYRGEQAAAEGVERSVAGSTPSAGPEATAPIEPAERADPVARTESADPVARTEPAEPGEPDERADPAGAVGPGERAEPAV